MPNFYRVDTRLGLATQVKYLNEMVLKLAGMVDQGKFDKHELEALYSDLGSAYVRKYIRNQGIGNTLADYSDWAHYKAEAGYSIWKILPTTYAHDSNNIVYMNNKALVNKGLATALASQFDYVFTYDDASGGSYSDVTTNISTEASDEVAVLADTGDYLYIGASAAFTGIKFEFKERGSNYTLKFEYYNGATWSTLGESDSLSDNTLNFLSDGLVSFDAPGDWASTTVNSQDLYWIRVSTTTAPITQAEIYYCTSGDSVEGLLSLSSTEIREATWKFCTFSGYVYATIQNSGAADYEGEDFITSTSSTSNKQNFFIYNNPFTGDYLNSAY